MRDESNAVESRTIGEAWETRFRELSQAKFGTTVAAMQHGQRLMQMGLERWEVARMLTLMQAAGVQNIYSRADAKKVWAAYFEIERGRRGSQCQELGLTETDLQAPVCSLCFWQQCERCRLANGDDNVDGAPALEMILQGEEYYDTLPNNLERRRDEEEEEPPTTIMLGDCLLTEQAGSIRISFPSKMRWAMLKDVEGEVEQHRAMQQVPVDDQPAARQWRTLLVQASCGMSKGQAVGSVQIGTRRQVKTYSPGTSPSQAAWKTVGNALYFARKELEQHPGQYDRVEVRLGNQFVREVLPRRNVHLRQPEMENLRQRVVEHYDALFLALHQGLPATEPVVVCVK